MNLNSLKQQYKQGALNPSSLVDAIFERIQSYQLVDPSVWICLRNKADVAKDAIELTKRWANKPLPPLYGIPFAVKDNIDVAGITTTAACAEYAYVAKDTAPVVSALLAAGAILIGKTNMDQFATGLSGARSPYGTPRSIFGGGSYISGGSSSGSGVSVAANLVSFALGTDTAGSGRVPAAFNGICGFKPTKGTLSARGVVPACKSLDTLSIFTHTTSDARNIWQVVDIYDEQDPYAKLPGTLPLMASEYRGAKKAGFTFACPPASALEICDEKFLALFSESVKALTKIGGRVQPLSEEEYKPFQEASELLYSGSLVYERIASIGPEVITSLLDTLHPTTRALFTSVSERDIKPWQVFEDQIKQAKYTRQAQKLFAKKFDVLVLPTVPFHPTVEEMEEDPIGLNAKIGEFTHFANVLDLCAISLNAGFYEGKEGKMPFGISLVCASGLDGRLFDIAQLAEEALRKA
jgi:allophanate hydrolase